jgi:hypothetical protein
MNWPNHTDYQDAIQNPHLCFQEPELKTGEAVCDVLGFPRVMSGNFASVYELRTANGRFAIRCFVRQVVGQQARYSCLSQYLSTLTMGAFVGFDFIQNGIKVRNEWFPMVRMEWVDGVPMNNYIEEHLYARPTLEKLADDWVELIAQLKQNKMAHGDLQNGNVLLMKDGEIKLVDYDGMYVPVFGRGRAPELGHINFQHPRRTAEFYDENLDDFSALVIYTSLRAIIADPDLFAKYYTGDNLIFSSADFKAPKQSELLQKLKTSTDPDVPKLAEAIELCCVSAVERVPDFRKIVTQLKAGNFMLWIKRTVAEPETQRVSTPAATATTTGGTTILPRPGMARPEAPAMSRHSPSPAPISPSASISRPAPMAQSRPATSRPAPSQTATRPAEPAPSNYPRPEESGSNSGTWKIVVIPLIIIIVALLIMIVRQQLQQIGDTPAPQPDTTEKPAQ